MKLHSIATVGVLALSALVLTRSVAQVPTLPGGIPAGMTPDQLAQLLQQNPPPGSLLRQRPQPSGLTADQIRAQLTATGYPAGLLDAYLGTALPGQGAQLPSSQTMAALQALGLATGRLSPEALGLDTGFIRTRGEAIPPESLAVGNYVFAVDVFRRATTQFLPLLSGP